jgi:pimeloyl-ACP methyl ester carboxylesterase
MSDADLRLASEEDDNVVRRSIEVRPGQRVSVRVWGSGEAEAVLLHGRGQNAHTWDAFVRSWGVPLIAIDLPGHGHSDWRADHDYGPWPNAEAVAVVIKKLAPGALVVVGMSLGGVTLIRLAGAYPELVRRAVVIDTTPASRIGRPALTKKEQGAVALLEGPSVFDSFEAILAAAAAVVPDRPIESLRRGVLRNARELDDGRWAWRYDSQPATGGGPSRDRTKLWEDLGSLTIPVMLVRSGRSGRVLNGDVAEFLVRQPSARVERIESAGHSIQSDQPELLARLIEEFVATTP